MISTKTKQTIVEVEEKTAELQRVFSELESMVDEDSPATSSFKATLFAGILAGLGGLLVGIAIGTTYIAPML